MREFEFGLLPNLKKLSTYHDNNEFLILGGTSFQIATIYEPND
jgi:hypothetical protein